MPAIPNYPQNLADEHMAWHMNPGNPLQGGRAINPWPPGATEAAPGSGQEFLQFHRNYIGEFHTWYDAQPGADQNAVAPWHAIPSELKMSGTGWPGPGNTLAQAEDRLTNQLNTFATADDLGRFIEWTIHGFLHNASSQVYGEPILASFLSPESTYFWGIHGLVDWWWEQWQNQHVSKFAIKDVIDGKGAMKPEIDKVRIFDKAAVKEIEKFRKEGKEVKEFKEDKEVKEIEKFRKEKDKDKDLVENKLDFEGDPGQQLGGDPMSLLAQVVQRLDMLEKRFATGQAFIGAEKRPDVGGGVKKMVARKTPDGGKKVAEELDQPKGGGKVEVHPEPKKPQA